MYLPSNYKVEMQQVWWKWSSGTNPCVNLSFLNSIWIKTVLIWEKQGWLRKDGWHESFQESARGCPAGSHSLTLSTCRPQRWTLRGVLNIWVSPSRVTHCCPAVCHLAGRLSIYLPRKWTRSRRKGSPQGQGLPTPTHKNVSLLEDFESNNTNMILWAHFLIPITRIKVFHGSPEKEHLFICSIS